MPDPLLFALGVLVTTVALIAVWSIGQLDEDDRSGEAAEPLDSRRKASR